MLHPFICIVHDLFLGYSPVVVYGRCETWALTIAAMRA